MAYATMAMQFGGSIVNALGSSMSGESSGRMYDYKAQVAKINEQIQKQNASYARDVGEVTAQESGMKTRAMVGRTMNVQSGSGFSTTGASAAGVRSSEIAIGQQDQAVIRADAARRAYGFDLEAQQASEQAKVYSVSAKESRKAGTIGAISSLLGGAGSVADKWLKAAPAYGNAPGGGGGGGTGLNLFGPSGIY